jgi:hypothetical protein
MRTASLMQLCCDENQLPLGYLQLDPKKRPGKNRAFFAISLFIITAVPENSPLAESLVGHRGLILRWCRWTLQRKANNQHREGWPTIRQLSQISFKPNAQCGRLAHFVASGPSQVAGASSHLLLVSRIMVPSEMRYAYSSPYNCSAGARGCSSLIPPASDPKISHFPS